METFAGDQVQDIEWKLSQMSKSQDIEWKLSRMTKFQDIEIKNNKINVYVTVLVYFLSLLFI